MPVSCRCSCEGTQLTPQAVTVRKGDTLSAIARLGYGPSVLLQDEATGLCLDGLAGSGVRVTEAKCGLPDHYQHWRIYVHSGYVKIHLAINLAYCVNAVMGIGGVTIQVCRSDVHQNWFEIPRAIPWNNLENSANSKCLDGSLQYGVRVATCISNDLHQWWA
jgi:hypothetical protein